MLPGRLEYGNRTSHEPADQFRNARDTVPDERVNLLLQVRNWNAFSGRDLDLHHGRLGHGSTNATDHQALGALDLRHRRNDCLRNVSGQDVVNLADMADRVLARIDTTELVAQLAGAKAAVHRAHQTVARAQADVTLREAELRLADVELKRGTELVRTNAITQADLDRRTAQRDVSKATLEGAKVAIEDGKAAIEVAEAQVTQIEATIADMTLKAPVTGRVEYRLAQAGEVVGAGGRVLTLLDLTDVHMTIFLPTGQAGRVELGSEARIVLDGAPEYVVPAIVSFVAAEAQFTPKYVETASEREKLMYRIKLHIDPQLLKTYRGYVKAGMTGNAYVKIRAGATWPENLVTRLPDAH